MHKPGKYVVAVSGGVDSMVLLDLLTRIPNLELVVAHFEHGVREDSMEDLRLVQTAAARYGLPFVYARGNLGAGVSEADARAARYAFLHQTRQEHGAAGIVTAHHQGDVVETALLNMLRGTGRRGLSSLKSTDTIVRPLLAHTKQELLNYAAVNNILWHEDSTNSDERYLRNYLRHTVVPKMTPAQHAALLAHIAKAQQLNHEIDAALHRYIQSGRLDRRWFIMLPHAVSAEVMAAWLRHNRAAFDRRSIDRLVVFGKTATPGKHADIDKNIKLHVGKEHITLVVASSTP
jgi:tRNA(Ile)-lysidine synthetase-like protein